MTNYVALIHKDADSDFGVSFPDFPGCVTAGSSLEAARSMAEEALCLQNESLLEDGDGVPPPSSLDEIMEQVEHRNAVAVLIAAKDQEKAIRVNITIPERYLRAIDVYARNHGLSRSGLLVKAAKQVMADDSV
ncbi:putative RNase H-like HicB family nuclease [Rhizobium sp. SG_E_25_P2]|uniref:type II toxin-antitoxin system HicB family antitoxin n=1 Tax=Rhizobium sp. SG_E_25_P2 TaxID=2879942 RepID=UPI0024765DB0|nr:type II toxin-antitoxin system HicB family antitoxin [Rhizobium sp. SG_E_25_P2]MDH6267146.1 putative RNase H-like HicB family nuclease [Rhizobium sp. SG_E_25_P2]